MSSATAAKIQSNVAALHSSPARPPRKLRIAPGVVIALRPGFLTPIQPKTKLGAIALQLAEQTVVTTLSVAAISSYVYALTQASAPPVTFTGVPPNMGPGQLPQLQGAYDDFMTQLATFQGQAGAWIDTQQGTGTASIFSQLVSIPTTLSNLNATVSANFALLAALTPGSPAYESTLAQQESLIGAENSAITSLVTQISTLGAQLQNATQQLVASTQTGVLAQLLAAYEADITTLDNAITNANNQISADNSKIIGLGFGVATSIGVGLIGLANWWNPLGWVMMAGGAVGTYYAITEIATLEAQIAKLKGDIQTDISYRSTDEQAAMCVSMFSNQLAGFASMNAAAQSELLELVSLYDTLALDIVQAVDDLEANELASAQDEWSTILQAASVLSNLTAYIWPNIAQLSAPSSFAAVGSDVYFIAMSGSMSHYSGSAGTWTNMGVTALSCVGQGSTLVAIDGAPIDGSQVDPNATPSTFFVKSYDMSSGAWTTISRFPAAAIATGGGAIYAIAQTVGDRRVYQYSGSGTSWTPLPQLPGSDAAMQIAVAGGVLFALSTNGQLVLMYAPSTKSWTPVLPQKCTSITANGNMLAIVDTTLAAYRLDVGSAQAPVNYGAGVTQIAQLSSGNQYRTAPDLSLWLADITANPVTYTQLATNITGVYASDTNLVYAMDNLGNLFLVDSSGTLQPIAGVPS